MLLLTLDLLVLCALIALSSYHLRRPRQVSFPPGPKPYPIIGNILELPLGKPWETYARWGRIYGSDILHAQALGNHILIINSHKIAKDLLERRAQAYSDRPHIPMIELLDWQNFNTVLMPYGGLWRRHRHIFQRVFRRDIIQDYHPILLTKTNEFLQNLLVNPDDFILHCRTVSAAIVMKVVYNLDIKSPDDRYVVLAERALLAASENLLPGSSIVNIFPALRHLPSWFPGCRFHRVAEACRKMTLEMRQAPSNVVKQAVRSGQSSSSILGRLFEECKKGGKPADEEKVMIDVASIAYAGGADTTVSSVTTFFLAMALNPTVQERALSELDRVLGPGCLPTFEDRASLPYIEAIYHEVLRWHPAVPLCVPHATLEDDVYEGWTIPKGTVVIPNIWAMTRDEDIFPDPETFRPERFLSDTAILEKDLAYGFGRRVCAGSNFASATLWIIIASVLSKFTITRARGLDGQEIDIATEFTDGAISHPKPFKCAIQPRSTKA
ncbi:cytochrome P450 [Pluteus cervinus]|uniref:Cytochrome P450 n=1 Tax=Pluteus cervinus TaxID=181527 RepID=A0ACD3AH18_9AGAR|nr:cytochrome P450 [Pluteus cervinus]